MLSKHGLIGLRAGNDFYLGQTDDGFHGISFAPALARFDQILADIRAASEARDRERRRIRKLRREFSVLTR